MADKTPEQRVKEAFPLPYFEDEAIIEFANVIREAEHAAYERAARACTDRGNKVEANPKIGEYMADGCDACARDIRALKHGPTDA